MNRYNLRSRSRSIDYSESDSSEEDYTIKEEEGSETEVFKDELGETLDDILRVLESKAAMAKADDDKSLSYQGLLNSVPLYDGSSKKNIDSFFRILENVADVGKWSDSQMMKLGKTRLAGVAQEFALSDEIRDIMDYKEF